MNVTTDFNKKTFKKLDEFPDKFLYRIARLTLDLTYPHIPLSREVNCGRLRSSSLAYAVKSHGNKDYSIGSQTGYAKYVWNMDNKTTHWSTPNTGSEWYKNEFKKKGQSIIKNAINTSL